MKNTILIIALLLTVSSCGTTHKMAKVAGVYQSMFLPIDQEEGPDNNFILILKKDGTLLDLESDGRYTGTWKFTQKNIIELKHKRWTLYSSISQFLDREAKIINRDSISIDGIPFVRIK